MLTFTPKNIRVLCEKGIDYDNNIIIGTNLSFIMKLGYEVSITNGSETYVSYFYQPIYNIIVGGFETLQYNKNKNKIREIIVRIKNTKEWEDIKGIVYDNHTQEYQELLALLKKYKNPLAQAFDDIKEINHHKDAIVRISNQYTKKHFSLFK